MTGNIYLIGFMGSGKSTVARILAQTLNRRFVDMDEELEKRFAQTIPDFFVQHGEEAFRSEETALLEELSAKRRLVVAAGGGAADRDRNRACMSDSGAMVHLDAKLESCKQRLDDAGRDNRPMWKDPEFVSKLFQRRRTVYAQAQFSVPVDEKSPQEASAAIITALFPDRRVMASLGGDTRPVICTWEAQEALSDAIRDRKVAVLTDKNVGRLHLERFRKVLGDPLVVTISPGDRSKTLQTSQRVYQTLLDSRFDRGDLLIAIGGGVVTDLGAFVAATFKRGMGFVLVSTSLLGCVDAAVGGKAAVNLGQAKNVVGCFTVPDLVILDLAALRTLRRNHLSEGLIEAYKTGLVASLPLAELVEREAPTLLRSDLPLLGQVAALSAETKADVVSRDFRESGLRRILNFGHTFGHAVEGFHKFKVSHGDAVALGMIVATILSESRKLLPREIAQRVIRTIRGICPGLVECPPLDESWEIMLHDKKIRRGRMVFVLLEGVGKPTVVEDVSREELSATLDRLDDWVAG